MHFVRATLVHARERNIDISSLLARSRISPGLVGIKDVRVSARQYADLQTLTMFAMNDEFVGYTPHPVPVGSWVAMCHWLINTRTLKQLVGRLCRFYAILGKGFGPRLEFRESVTILHVEPLADPAGYGLYGYELFLFACYRLLCWMTREKIPLHRIQIPFPRPPHHREYGALFYGYPVTFDRESCSLSFHNDVLNLPIRQDLASLNQMLGHPLHEIIIQDHDRSSWSARVMNAIQREPAGENSLAGIAAGLGTNAHTLRRRLADEGQQFIRLKQEVKRDISIHCLSGTGMSVEEVAYHVGFSEASAFIRAFKQWTGVTPYTYRKDS